MQTTTTTSLLHQHRHHPFTNNQPTNQPTKAADEQTSCAPWRGFTPKQTPQRLLLLMTSSCILPKRCHAFLSYYLMEKNQKKKAFWHLCGRKKVERINTSKVGDCQSLVASHPDPHLPPQPKRNFDTWACLGFPLLLFSFDKLPFFLALK